MYRTLTTSEAADELQRDENAAWSYNGARALVEYLEECESDIAPIEFDRVAIRCDYSEYSSALSAAEYYDFEAEPGDDDDTTEAAALEYLQDMTTVITFKGGIIIQDY